MKRTSNDDSFRACSFCDKRAVWIQRYAPTQSSAYVCDEHREKNSRITNREIGASASGSLLTFSKIEGDEDN